MSISCFELRVKILLLVIRVLEVMDTLTVSHIRGNESDFHLIVPCVKKPSWQKDFVISESFWILN